MNRIAQFSVRFPTTIAMIVLGILLLGYISFTRLGIDLLPDLNSPRLFVEVRAGERPPEEMEYQFVSQLEAMVARGRGVEDITSISKVGRALLTVEFSWDSDMDEAFLDLQKITADFSQNLDVDEITVSQHDPNATAMVIAVLSHTEIRDIDRLRQTAENNIRNELIRLPGIAAVEVVGAQSKEIEISTDASRLEAFGLTVDQLVGTILNANRNISGGSIVEMGRRYIIRGIGELTGADDIGDLIVTFKSPSAPADATAASERVPVYLRDVADIGFGLSEAENIVRHNGRRCLGLEIFKEAKFSTIEAASRARDQLEQLRASLPGYQIEIVQDQSQFIRTAVTEVEHTGLIGIVLAVIILYVFLRRAGVTAVISIAIPVSIVATFNLMYFNGLTLNIMTLGGLALGAGMLVDNAIVVVENIYRHLEEGRKVAEAAIRGAGEVGGAITSSTLTTIVVFLPIVYLHGAAGELFKEQAWTVVYSLLASLFVALAVIPMLCSRLLKSRSSYGVSKEAVAFPKYAALLRRILSRRGTVVLVGVVLVAGTAAVLPFVGSEFMPTSDQGEILVNITLPEGTSLERTDGVVRNIEAIIDQRFGEALSHLYSRIGQAGTSSDERDALADENSAQIQIVLTPETDVTVNRVLAALDTELSRIPDIEPQLIVQQTALKATLGTDSPPLVVEIKGDDLEQLGSLSDTLLARLTGLRGLTNLESSLEAGRPELNIEIDRTLASQYNLSSASIGSQLTDILSGREAGQILQDGQYTDILVRRPQVSLTELEQTLVETGAGRRVRLGEVAHLSYSYAPREIVRNNQVRTVSITAHLTDEESFDRVASDVRSVINGIHLPAEYSMTVTGEEKLREEAFGSLSFALLLAIILVYMVMAAQFESLLHPFVILLTIPLAAVGSVWLLLALDMQFNIMSLIGLILLAGIAVNDSIILVDRINQNRRSGQEVLAAIINAGQTRIRPILMTSATTILALLPLTIGVGEGASLRAPMAVTVIGGLVTSTLLTLVVIPAVYSAMAGRINVSTRGE